MKKFEEDPQSAARQGALPLEVRSSVIKAQQETGNFAARGCGEGAPRGAQCRLHAAAARSFQRHCHQRKSPERRREPESREASTSRLHRARGTRSLGVGSRAEASGTATARSLANERSPRKRRHLCNWARPSRRSRSNPRHVRRQASPTVGDDVVPPVKRRASTVENMGTATMRPTDSGRPGDDRNGILENNGGDDGNGDVAPAPPPAPSPPPAATTTWTATTST